MFLNKKKINAVKKFTVKYIFKKIEYRLEATLVIDRGPRMWSPGLRNLQNQAQYSNPPPGPISGL